jgi:hypothetical protein
MRISFKQDDAEHLYELAFEHFQKGCCICDKIKRRMELSIGKNNVRKIRKRLKEYPYCVKNYEG